MEHTQTEFDFSKRGCRLRLLESLRFTRDDGRPIDELADAKVSGAALVALLKALEGYSGDDGRAYPKQETLAENLAMSPRQIRRVIKAAKSLQILDVKRWKYTASYQIIWSNLADFDGRQPEPRADMVTGQIGHGVRSDRTWCPVRPDMVTGEIGHGDLSVKPPKNRPENRPPNRAEVEAALSRRGVGMARQAAQAALAAGLSPDEAAAIVEHFDAANAGDGPDAFSSGALYHRFANARSGQSPDQGWPPPSDASKNFRLIRTQKDRRRREQERRLADEAQRQAETQTAADLERRYGPAIDAMSDAEKLATLRGKSGIAADYWRAKGDTPLTREMLIAALAANDQQPVEATS